MKIELSDTQVKQLTTILNNYYNGRQSVAAEAPIIGDLAKAIQTPVKEEVKQKDK